MSPPLCYLDNAATTFPKPRSVIDEVTRCLSTYCGNPGRGAHSLSLAAANKIYDCRVAAAELIGLDAPENIVFVPNTTYGLNLIIKGLLHYGDHVIISDMEHNSVYRPIYKMAQRGEITFDVFPALSLGNSYSPELICKSIERLIKGNTRLIICNHQSNICSLALPIQKIGELCKKYGIIFALDVAQSAGHIELDMKSQHIDLLCAPGHKGLYGLQGSGFVAIGNGVLLDTLIEGGNGVQSLSPEMPDFSPERYESGTLPTPCIAGLCEGIREIKRIGVNTISQSEELLFLYLRERLKNMRGITLYADEHIGNTLLFNIDGLPSDRVASLLDKYGICVRGGFHCSALAHRALGTPESGAARVSFGIFNTKKDIERLLFACNDIIKSNIAHLSLKSP